MGYVGLPLAVCFGRRYETIGFDIEHERISELRTGIDKTGELSKEEVLSSENLSFSSNLDEIKNCDVYIIAVPTPIDEGLNPDLEIIKNASQLVGGVLNENNVVVYESTVYPGCTEEICIPILEEQSHLTVNKNLFCGYSPERVVPGDKSKRVENIMKITSGSNEFASKFIDKLYASVILAGTYPAKSIRVAEAAKVIENVQRDVNISLVNEFSKIFSSLDIDTRDVLDAAETKWNFLKFKPGLVGGHCIGVDPYYLIHKANSTSTKPELIETARKINHEMSHYVANKIDTLLKDQQINSKANILIIGFTFKANCSDIRNTKVFDLFTSLESKGFNVEIYDPVADSNEVQRYYKIKLQESLKTYDGVVYAVDHDDFNKLDFTKITKEKHVLFDLTASLPRNIISGRL